MLVMIVFSLYNMTKINQNMARIIKINYPKIQLTNTLERSFQQIVLSIHVIVLYNDTQSINQELKNIEEARKVYSEAYAELDKLPIYTEKGRLLKAKIMEIVKNAKRTGLPERRSQSKQFKLEDSKTKVVSPEDVM